MLVVYFKDDGAILRKHGFSLLVTSAKYEDSSKSQIDNISAKRENNEKIKTTLFSQTFEVPESKVLLFFSFLASRPSY